MIVEIRHHYTHGIRAFKIWQAVSRGCIVDLSGARVFVGGLAVFYGRWILGQRHERRAGTGGIGSVIHMGYPI